MNIPKWSGLAASAVIALAGFYEALPAQGVTADWQKGANVYPVSAADFSSSSFQQSLRNLKAIHADYVTLVVPYYQSSLTSADPAPGANTPAEQYLMDGINFAHGLGFKVNLKLHVDVAGSSAWRANINPSDRPAWFSAYGGILNDLGRTAERTGVEEMTIGTELIDLASDNYNSANTAGWRTLIRNLRQIYSGKLTYSANWGASGWNDEKNNIVFWDDLDYIGISAYFYMADRTGYTMDSLAKKWDYWDRTSIQPLSQKYGKPILFTEAGYRSMDGSLIQPPKWQLAGAPDMQEQADGYAALINYWQDKPYFAGIQIWDWHSDPNAGGPNDSGFTPQNKPAAQILAQWFGEGRLPLPTMAFRASAGGNGSYQPGVPGNMTANVSNWGSTVYDAIVDVEVYDAYGNQIIQQFFEGQTLAGGATEAYSITWTPPGTGEYVAKIGLFARNWNSLLYWQDEAAVFSVNDGIAPNASEIVMRTEGIPAGDVHGSWSLDPDPAGYRALHDPDRNAPKTASPLASPANYFDLTFSAPANVPYHIWLRLKADRNYYGNDSVFVQFSDSVNASGTPAYRIGSADALPVILEEGTGAGVKSWGWNDDRYGGLGVNFKFANSGTHTLRIQQREDGAWVDQVVLSPRKYLSARPGGLMNDATFLPLSPMPALPDALSASDITVNLSENGTVRGLVSLQGSVSGVPASQYGMFWQVDGDRLNQMFPDDNDPYLSQAWVDFTGWNWNGSGPYLLNFVVKTPDGRQVGEKNVHIYVGP